MYSRHILRDAPSGAPQDEVPLEINDLPYPGERPPALRSRRGRRLEGARLEGSAKRFTTSQVEPLGEAADRDRVIRGPIANFAAGYAHPEGLVYFTFANISLDVRLNSAMY